MSNGSEGLTTVLTLLGVRADTPADAGAAQDDLFEASDAPLPLPVLGERGKSGPKGGRPANVPNKSTEAWARMFLGQHRSPLMVLGNIMSQDTEALTDHLQRIAAKHRRLKSRTSSDKGTAEAWDEVLIDPLAVLKVQVAAAIAVAPYLHKQQPKAIEVAETKRGVVIMSDVIDGQIDEAEEADGLPLAGEEKAK